MKAFKEALWFDGRKNIPDCHFRDDLIVRSCWIAGQAGGQRRFEPDRDCLQFTGFCRCKDRAAFAMRYENGIKDDCVRKIAGALHRPGALPEP